MDSIRIKRILCDFISFRLPNAPSGASTRSNLDSIVVLFGVSAPENGSQLQKSLLLAGRDSGADTGRAWLKWNAGIDWLLSSW